MFERIGRSVRLAVMSRKGLLLFLACGIVWGIPYFFIKVAVEDFSAPTVILARTAIGAIVLVPIALKRKAFLPALRKWKTVLVFALFEMIGPWWLINNAENGHINSGLAGLLIATVPFFAMAIGYFYIGDKTAAHPKNILGLVFGFGGILLLVGIDAFTQNLEVVWVGAMILAAIGYAVAPAIASKTAPDVEMVGILSLSMAVSALFYVIPSIMNPLAPGVVTPSVGGWVSLAVLGAVCSALAFVLFFALIREVSYSRSTLITYVNTAVAILIGVAFGNEPFTVGMAVGLPLVAVGSYLASRQHN
ncbi:MAG: DMT family transporter [Microbacteriaceae bacterium]